MCLVSWTFKVLLKYQLLRTSTWEFVSHFSACLYCQAGGAHSSLIFPKWCLLLFPGFGLQYFPFSELAPRFPLTYCLLPWLGCCCSSQWFLKYYLSQFVPYLQTISPAWPLLGSLPPKSQHSPRLRLWPESHLFLVISFNCQFLSSCLCFSCLCFCST